MTPRYAFQPDYAIPPGDFLEEILAAIGMKKSELARRCRRPEKVISEILHAKAAITPETAIQFERVLDRPAAFWLALQSQYDLRRAEQSEDDSIEPRVAWAKRFPVKALVQRGAIKPATDPKDLVRKLLKFFGVASIDAWEDSFGGLSVAFRQSKAFEAQPEAVTAWLRLGEVSADEVDCAPFDRSAFKRALAEGRTATTLPHAKAFASVVKRCASAGVAVVWIPELPNTRVSGAARWLSKDKALIQLSGRYQTTDHFWFTFFHEAGHILLHGKKQMFIDDDVDGTAEAEEQANAFARDLLIPSDDYESFVEQGRFSDTAMTAFAKRLGVHTSIVVGRLQHDKVIRFSTGNTLKARIEAAV